MKGHLGKVPGTERTTRTLWRFRPGHLTAIREEYMALLKIRAKSDCFEVLSISSCAQLCQKGPRLGLREVLTLAVLNF